MGGGAEQQPGGAQMWQRGHIKNLIFQVPGAQEPDVLGELLSSWGLGTWCFRFQGAWEFLEI